MKFDVELIHDEERIGIEIRNTKFEIRKNPSTNLH